MAAAYEPRQFTFLGLWTAGDVALKAYGITVAGAAPISQQVLDAAREVVAGTLPAEAAAEGESLDLGFVVLHAGTAGNWLLMHWWAHEDICCQRLAHAPSGSARFQSVDERPLMACVWELVAIGHENRAFVRHLLTEAPDRAAYLADLLPDGLY